MLCCAAGVRVVSIAAGPHHSLVATEEGGVLAWGSREHGRLGIGQHGEN